MQVTPDSVQTYLQSLIDQAKAGLQGGAYAASVLDAYLFGYSFAWLFAKEQLQLNGAAGDRGVNVPVNAFYTNTTPDAISTGGVAPDANVLYANAFLQVSPGNPVVVQLPNVQSALQFFSVQSANSATQNYQLPGSSTTFYDQSSVQSVANPAGGQMLFYWGTDDPGQYSGEFTQRIAVNTATSFLTGRVLVDPSLVNAPADGFEPSTYAVSTIADLNAQFVAAGYDRFVANGYTMAGLENESNPDLTAEVQAAYRLYSGPLRGEFFWQTLADALNQSYPPSFGIGSEAGLQGTPLAYSQQLSAFGIVYNPQTGYQFDRSAVTDVTAWLEATEVAYKLVTSIDTLASDSQSGSWQNVPATLGDYANSLVGYLMRDVAHIANSPASAVYPLTYHDTQGESLMGGQTYILLIRNALAGGLPPLAPQNVSAMSNLLMPEVRGLTNEINQGGFWSLTAYDPNLNVTPAINQSVVVAGQPVPVNYTQAVNPGLAPDTFLNPNTGSSPYTLSSLQLPAQLGEISAQPTQPAQPTQDSVPAQAQFRFEEDGDLLLILSPYRPVDSRYWNNWLPTPLITFDSNFSTVTDAQTWQPFSEPSEAGVPYSLMLRVYNPNVMEDELGQAVMHQAGPGTMAGTQQGQVWSFPSILEVREAALTNDLSALVQSLAMDQTVVLRPDMSSQIGGLGLNTAVVAGARTDVEVSTNGVDFSVRGLTDEGMIDVTLTNFQQIQFTDQTLVLDLVGAPNIAIYSLYQAAFDRTADLAGFRYWSVDFASGRANITQIAQSFVQSSEFVESELDTLANADFVDVVYQNAFDRNPDAAGFEYWMTALEGGATRAEVLASVAASTESWALVMQEQPIGLSLSVVA